MDYLEYLYSGKGNLSRIYEVSKGFYHSEKEVKSLTTSFMELKKTYKELHILLPFGTDIKVQHAQRERMAIMNFLAGLPFEHAQRERMAIMNFLAGLPFEIETAKSHILSRSEISFLKDVFSRVLLPESTPSN
ncbi:hypothetical protein KY290_017874 [Solanum tuberosum]|uniref:Uncharacterized protein n=1 Tax=Solanum tuberosum TaxID=4113 RepID=A0ABQ7VCK5_SOLTU|nr:hypothetical protein KY285_016833 [Solanum tuberosum]KAH0761801.1 hypothetical protein KY290_017874 [Solanum tuberosum]